MIKQYQRHGPREGQGQDGPLHGLQNVSLRVLK